MSLYIQFKTGRLNVRFCYSLRILFNILFYVSISYKFGTVIALNYFN